MKKIISGTICWQQKEEDLERQYQILCEATHTITGEKLVIYQQLYEKFSFFAMSKEEFLTKFEEVKTEEVKTEEVKTKEIENKSDEKKESKEAEMDSDLAAFLDTSDPAEKLEWLYQLKKHLNEHLMSSIEISMDLPVGTDSLEERLDYVKRHLQTVARFGSNRLR